MSVTVQESVQRSNGQSRVAKPLLDARCELIDLIRRNRVSHTPRTGSRPHCLEILSADPNTLFVGLRRDNKFSSLASGSKPIGAVMLAGISRTSRTS